MHYMKQSGKLLPGKINLENPVPVVKLVSFEELTKLISESFLCLKVLPV